MPTGSDLLAPQRPRASRRSAPAGAEREEQAAPVRTRPGTRRDAHALLFRAVLAVRRKPAHAQLGGLALRRVVEMDVALGRG